MHVYLQLLAVIAIAHAAEVRKLHHKSSDTCPLETADEADLIICVADCGKKLSLIDSSVSSCPSKTVTELPWKQTFQPNITYVAGQTIRMEDDGQNDGPQVAVCPEGSVATGGGWLRLSGNMEAIIAYDGPLLAPNVTYPVGWQVRLEADGPGDFIESQTFAVCMSMMG